MIAQKHFFLRLLSHHFWAREFSMFLRKQRMRFLGNRGFWAVSTRMREAVFYEGAARFKDFFARPVTHDCHVIKLEFHV
jgi:hypothetical protein